GRREGRPWEVVSGGGRAPKPMDPADPLKGLVFDGRIAEDFKLNTGTFVSVGPLRAKFLAHCQPWALDLAVTGQDGEYVGALIFPNAEACRLLDPAALREKFQALLD